MFLQVAVPKNDSRCLRFLWREDPEQRIEVYKYTRHVFEAKSSPTCANYALHQVAKDNAVNDESLVRTVQRNFYMDNFLKSVRTFQEAIHIYQKVRDILIKAGFKLTNWIKINDEIKSHIPETDKSTKVVKNLHSRTTIIFNPWTQLECGHRQSHCLSWNWARSSNKNNSENCPILCLSSVRPTWDMFPFTIRMRFPLKSIWAAIGEAWDKDLSTGHSKLFIYWCSEFRDIRTINRLYFENGC